MVPYAHPRPLPYRDVCHHPCTKRHNPAHRRDGHTARHRGTGYPAQRSIRQGRLTRIMTRGVTVLDKISSYSICRTLNTIHAVFLLLVSGFLLFNVVTLMMFSIGNWSPSILSIISLGWVVAAWGAAGGSLVIFNPSRRSTIFAFAWYGVTAISLATFLRLIPLFRGSGID